jgi:hypothetical protein
LKEDGDEKDEAEAEQSDPSHEEDNRKPEEVARGKDGEEYPEKPRGIRPTLPAARHAATRPMANAAASMSRAFTLSPVLEPCPSRKLPFPANYRHRGIIC